MEHFIFLVMKIYVYVCAHTQDVLSFYWTDPSNVKDIDSIDTFFFEK